MKKPNGWWRNPQTLVSILVGLTALSSWVVNTIMADARQAAKIEETAKAVAELDDAVDKHEETLEEQEIRYQIIQRDLGSISKTQDAILEELKKRR